jgi:hypothetical protein
VLAVSHQVASAGPLPGLSRPAAETA